MKCPGSPCGCCSTVNHQGRATLSFPLAVKVLLFRGLVVLQTSLWEVEFSKVIIPKCYHCCKQSLFILWRVCKSPGHHAQMLPALPLSRAVHPSGTHPCVSSEGDSLLGGGSHAALSLMASISAPVSRSLFILFCLFFFHLVFVNTGFALISSLFVSCFVISSLFLIALVPDSNIVFLFNLIGQPYILQLFTTFMFESAKILFWYW